MNWIAVAVIFVLILGHDAIVDYAVRKKFSTKKVFLSGFLFGAIPSLIIFLSDLYRFLFDGKVSSLGSWVGWLLIVIFPLWFGVLSLTRYEKRV
ncbi:hypothetical protein [Marinimicrobium alkaliphilum]|uniref:hypothetical protein n=1 Tax=Marinimicrobium alkaliphilum TaxID=2202654 RepID=UPI0013004842|nr:hypothetical protein [Marinimicrobium alkaliphilum]